MTAEELGQLAYQKMKFKKHEEAITILNGAIARFPQNEKLLANRCYSYLQLQDYDRALQDANHLTSNFATYPRGFFLKGEIFLKQEKHRDSEEEFSRVLELIPSEEAEDKLFEARIKQILAKGYDADIARKALRLSCDVQDAVNTLALGLIKKSDDDQRILCFDLTLEEEMHLANQFDRLEEVPVAEDGWSDVCSKPQAKLTSTLVLPKKKFDPLMDPANPLKSRSLWVGNVVAAKESKLRQMFIKYGAVESIKIHEKWAFINYFDHQSAGSAMKDLQNKFFENQKMLIKYPDNVLPGGRVKK